MPLVLSLAACATLPSSGPTGQEIRRDSRVATALPFPIVEVASAALIPPPPARPLPNLIVQTPAPTDLIGNGDVLDITIYEAGVALFGGSARLGAAIAASGASAVDPTSNAEKLPPVRVDDAGFINVPFVGRIRAAGRTSTELAGIIRRGLHGLSQDPQVLVGFQQSISNTVLLSGEVTRPGRLVLTTNRESLNDVIALAGGYRGDARDNVARVERGGRTYEIRLGDLMDDASLDIPIAPGDRVTIISRPQTFSVLGASNKVEEVRFPRANLSLAQAVALAGGANPSSGDAGAIFIFRYVLQDDGSEKPTVYHLNMMRAGSYFLSQRFAMRDGDVLYVGNARANQPTKFIQLLSQLFVPIITVRSAAGL